MLSNKYSEIRGNIRIAANSIGTFFRLGWLKQTCVTTCAQHAPHHAVTPRSPRSALRTRRATPALSAWRRDRVPRSPRRCMRSL